MKGTTVWVTGAAGFIGFHAARLLLVHGHSVVGLEHYLIFADGERADVV